MHSEHFSEKELACHHCGVNGVVQELLDALELLRAKLGKPIIVDDAYRCPVHNAAIGGVADSQHVLGRAADIQVKGKTARELYQIGLLVPQIKGLGVNDQKQYLHVDVRETVYLAQWCYGESGSQVPFYAI
jgi:uncharacterized protein YcbK (DUF882 family)